MRRGVAKEGLFGKVGPLSLHATASTGCECVGRGVATKLRFLLAMITAIGADVSITVPSSGFNASEKRAKEPIPATITPSTKLTTSLLDLQGALQRAHRGRR